MRKLRLLNCLLLLALLLEGNSAAAQQEALDIWPGLAPGETTRHTGDVLPFRATEVPPVTRVVRISRPTVSVFLADDPNGTAVVILPGGGFRKVVPDKEGSEAALWLNQLGVSAFVLNYRTTDDDTDGDTDGDTDDDTDDDTNDKTAAGWVKPLQDAQRTMALLRSRANEWGIEKRQLGVLGFSAGGQVAARLLTADGKLQYAAHDSIDTVSHRPDFALLIYPWQIFDSQRNALVAGVAVAKDWPPTFLVHTDDDASSSLGAVRLYGGLKRHGISAELHVYGNGGHGYGLRPVAGSQIATWPDHAAHWLSSRGLLK